MTQDVVKWQARVSEKCPIDLIVAFGGGLYIKDEYRNVPPELEMEMPVHEEIQKRKSNGDIVKYPGLEYKNLGKSKADTKPKNEENPTPQKKSPQKKGGS